MSRPLPPVLALPAFAAVLRSLGFHRTHRSESGSVYLGLRGLQFRLRLSDHQWSGYSRRGYCDVVYNVVLTAPVDPREIDGLAFSIAIGFVLRARIRLGQLGEMAA